MSRIITTTVYTLNELSATAQEKARDWYRQHHADSNWYENVYEDFRAVCDIFGIDLRQRVFRLINGRFMEEPCIWFSGFCSQGDGACFEGSGTGSQRHPGKSGNMPRRTVNFIVSRMPCRRCRNVTSGSYRLKSVTGDSPVSQAMTADAEAAVSEALRDLAFWLYRQLENEYDWLTSDAAVDEALLINEYTFTEAGLRAG